MTFGTSGSWIDRRAALRYQVRVPILFDGGDGVTRNISSTGVCFETATQLALGAAICFALPFGTDGAGERITVRCEGCVVRVEEPGRGSAGAYVVAAKSSPARFHPRID